MMSDTSNTPNDNPEENAANEAVADEAHATANDMADGEGAVDPVEALRSENAEMKDRVLRTMAEMENLRRRTEKEVRESRQYSVANFARDMLGVSDNLRRALDAISDDARASADEAMRVLIEGVELTEREMINQLEKHGVKKLNPEGERFDPNFHQAMFEVPNTEVPNNTVVQVVQAGYIIGDRVLRLAMVGVSKGGPKERKPDAPQAEPGATVDKTA